MTDHSTYPIADLLILGGTIVPIDDARRVIADGFVLVRHGRISAVGPRAELPAGMVSRQTIDASGMLVLPGLIDAHAHAGHALVKTLGSDDGEAWFEACRRIYTTASDAAFWRADARLFALERIKAGVTTGVAYLGGGDSISRTDNPAFGEAHLAAIAEIGTRGVLAVGTNRPPFPWRYVDLESETAVEREISFDRQLNIAGGLVDRWHGAEDGRLSVALTCPVRHPSRPLPADVTERDITAQAKAVRALAREKRVRFTQDGHRAGSIAHADRVHDLLGPDAYFSHCTDLTEDDIAALVRTGTAVVHNPSAVASIHGRCPVPELLDLGVTVAIGSDAPAPDRSADMFRHMQQAMHYHRRHFRDDQVLPPGKALEMVTVDAARALGLEAEIGSLEPGKKADIVLLDLAKPHLVPANMPVHRAVYFANAADIDTTIVDGRVLMRGRRLVGSEEAAILAEAEEAAAKAIERAGLERLLDPRSGFWRHSRYD